MKNSLFLIILSFLLCQMETFSQEKTQNWSMNGYVSNMQSASTDSIKGTWLNDNLIHNRLNFRWNPSNTFTFGMDVRNRIFTGESVKLNPNYGSQVASDNGLADLSWSLIDEKSIVLNTAIDRLWFSYETGKLNVTLGRQRINWGQTFAWNPNDIFNSYSFFDFDYTEKPGSDALRIQYYTGMASSVELATKINSDEKITAAALFRFNKWNYDMQVLAGIVDEQDYVAGIGWSGNLAAFSFRGEMSYLRAKKNFADTKGITIATLSVDYMFANSLSVQFEFLYNQQEESQGFNFFQFYEQTLSVKKLSFTEYNYFFSFIYPISPLLSASFSAMYYPEYDGYFAGPSLDYSLGDNINFSIFVQSFSGEFENRITLEKEKQSISLGFLRLKINF